VSHTASWPAFHLNVQPAAGLEEIAASTAVPFIGSEKTRLSDVDAFTFVAPSAGEAETTVGLDAFPVVNESM